MVETKMYLQGSGFLWPFNIVIGLLKNVFNIDWLSSVKCTAGPKKR